VSLKRFLAELLVFNLGISYTSEVWSDLQGELGSPSSRNARYVERAVLAANPRDCKAIGAGIRGAGRGFPAPVARPPPRLPAQPRLPLRKAARRRPRRALLTIIRAVFRVLRAASESPTQPGYPTRLPCRQGCYAPDAGPDRKGWGNLCHMLEKPQSCHHLHSRRQARKNGVFGGLYPIVAPRCFALAKQGTTASITRVRGTPPDVTVSLDLGFHDKTPRSPPRFSCCRTGKNCHSRPVSGVTVSSGIPAA
jgi:hypothetical protein